MSLSDEIDGYDPVTQLVVRGDVKKAVKELMEELCLGCKGKGCTNCKAIEKHFGEKLI